MPSIMDPQGGIDQARLAALPEAEQARLGQVLFMHHCNDCHAPGEGYSGVAPVLRGWSRPMIEALVAHPEQARFFMPPWAGTPEEAQALAAYLESIAPAYPQGMRFGAAQ